MTDFNKQLEKITAQLAEGTSRITLTGLTGSSPAFLLSRLLNQCGQLFIVVTADAESAEELLRELLFFAAKPEEILHFPAWDVPPLEAASPHADITGARLNTLFRLNSKQARVVVAPYAAVVQKVLPRQTLGISPSILWPAKRSPVKSCWKSW